jgi:phosphoribosylaminoimidazole-succinocarboxamide synthase
VKQAPGAHAPEKESDAGEPLQRTDIRSLPLVHRGKVRDTYAVGADRLLIVTSDRISAFDVVMDQPIPGKGRVLQAMTELWFARLAHLGPNHLTGIDPESVVAPGERDQVRGRSVVAMRLAPLPLEAVVRGYLAGSGWSDYQRDGAVCGVRLPAGLVQAQRLAGPIFTPAHKAPAGQHDENIDFAQACELVGPERAAEVRDFAVRLYVEAARIGLERGIIIADTKFEFGLDGEGRLRLMDEVLTPDSSRFWPVDGYHTGISPPSFDKQYLRDWLLGQPWNKAPPPPRLPAEVVERTASRYREALERLRNAS